MWGSEPVAFLTTAQFMGSAVCATLATRRFLVRISPEKRQELVRSLGAFTLKKRRGPSSWRSLRQVIVKEFELGGRYSLKAGAAIDWVDAGSTTATAEVYELAFGVGF